MYLPVRTLLLRHYPSRSAGSHVVFEMASDDFNVAGCS